MMKKKILIYINQVCLRGGVEKVFYNLINNLNLNKYDITILTTVAYLKDDLNIKIYKKPIHRFYLQYDEFSENKLLRLYQRIYNKIAPPILKLIMKNIKWDTAIAAQEGMYARFVIETKANKRLLWIHNDMNLMKTTVKSFGDREKEGECYKKFDSVICVSEDVKKSMISEFGDMDNLCVRYNPIDTFEIEEKSKQEIEEKVSQRPLLVAVGRLCHQKGFDRLLKTVMTLNEEKLKYEIWIVGEGESRQELEKTIKENKIENVKLLGYRSNPFAYMSKSDWVICVSRHEGFNMVLHEAVYIGKPVLTTRNAGAEELLGKNEYGIIIDNDEKSITDALRQIIEDNELNEKYKKDVKQRKSFVDLQERVRKIEELL